MITEKDTIRCEAVFNDAHTHRYLWKRMWDKNKPLAAIVMLNPCQADNIIADTTTSLVVNNIARLESYGGVVVVNLYSLLTNKLHFRWNEDARLNDEENDDYIVKAAEMCSTVILAWGKTAESNRRIALRAKAVLELLSPYEEKLRIISDGIREGLHPLTPSLRRVWQLKDCRAWIQKQMGIAETASNNNPQENASVAKEESQQKPQPIQNAVSVPQADKKPAGKEFSKADPKTADASTDREPASDQPSADPNASKDSVAVLQED
jgi:hypothetical protein